VPLYHSFISEAVSQWWLEDRPSRLFHPFP